MKLNKNIISALFVSGLAFAAPAAAETLKLATIAPEGSVWAKHINEFADAVNASGTGVEIEVFAGAQLGNMIDTFKNTLSGRVDIWAGASPVQAAVTPEIGLFSLPYLFDSFDQMICAVPKLEDASREVIGGKYQLLTWVAVGSQDISANTPIRVPSDLSGMKMRSAPIPASMSFMTAAGATPQPLPASETPSAISTGLVSGSDFDGVYYTLMGLHKTTSNFTSTNHNVVLGGYIMSAQAWGGLNDEQKAAVMAAASSLDFGKTWTDIEAFENVMLQKAVSEGATLIELTDEEHAQWVETGRSVWDSVISNMKGDPQAFLAKIEAARQSCM